jgi:hypothetical protein
MVRCVCSEGNSPAPLKLCQDGTVESPRSQLHSADRRRQGGEADIGGCRPMSADAANVANLAPLFPKSVLRRPPTSATSADICDIGICRGAETPDFPNLTSELLARELFSEFDAVGREVDLDR